MMEKFKELLKEKAKKGDYVDEKKKKAKLDVLDQIDDIMEENMGNKLKNLKKVTVASDSEEGLKKGLEMAKEKIDESEAEACEECEGKGCEACEMMEEESEEKEEDGMSLEEKIKMHEKMIEELKAKKKK